MHIDQHVEEILERLWTLREQGQAARPDLDGSAFDFDPGAATSEHAPGMLRYASGSSPRTRSSHWSGTNGRS